MKSHISYNQFKNWNECQFFFKLDKVYGLLEKKGNLFLAFGKAIHSTIEYAAHENGYKTKEVLDELDSIFAAAFMKELETLKSENFDFKEDGIEELFKDMYESGKVIVTTLFPELEKTFGEFEILAVEEELRQPLSDDYDFLGYVDFVIKQKTTNKIILLDWKTTSWGWREGYDRKTGRSEKKSDKITIYQLIYYKHFWLEKHKEIKEDIDTYFVLLKRKPGKKSPIEFFKVSSGKKRIKNALEKLDEMLEGIKKGKFMKNRLHCHKFLGYNECVFYNTQHCPRI